MNFNIILKSNNTLIKIRNGKKAKFAENLKDIIFICVNINDVFALN